MLAGNMVDCENKIRVTVKRLKDEKKQTVLYGAGYCGRETLQLMQTHGIPVLAICDDFRVGEYLNTVKISDIRDIEIGEDTIIFITGGFNEKMKRNLYRLGLAAHYVDVDFGRYDPEKETRSYFLEHRAELERAYDLLTDKKSKQWFINLINYRISRDLKYLDGMQESSPQYFPIEEDLNLAEFMSSRRGGGDIP